MNKMRIGKDGKTSEMRRTGRRWRKFGFVKLEKTVSVHLQVAWLREPPLVIMIEQERSCVRQELDKTDTE